MSMEDMWLFWTIMMTTPPLQVMMIVNLKWRLCYKHALCPHSRAGYKQNTVGGAAWESRLMCPVNVAKGTFSWIHGMDSFPKSFFPFLVISWHKWAVMHKFNGFVLFSLDKAWTNSQVFSEMRRIIIHCLWWYPWMKSTLGYLFSFTSSVAYFNQES